MMLQNDNKNITNYGNLFHCREEAWKNSPENHCDRIYSNCRNAKVKVVVGGNESPESIRQSKSFHKVSISLSNFIELISYSRLVVDISILKGLSLLI